MSYVIRLTIFVISVFFISVEDHFEISAQELIRRSYSNLEWSPDGTMVTFLYDPYFQANDIWDPTQETIWQTSIMLANADGSNIRRLTTGNVDQNPKWSPDSSMILFERRWSLFIIDLDGNIIVHVPAELPENIWCGEQLVRGWSYSWSPDSEHVLYATKPDSCATENRDDENFANIFVLNVASGESQLISTSTYPEGWSLDGRLAVTRYEDRNCRLHLVGLDGTDEATGAVRPTYDCPTRGDLAWSPDGSTVYAMDNYFETDNWNTLDIKYGLPAWSPDGSQLALMWTNVFYTSSHEYRDPRIVIYNTEDWSELNNFSTDFFASSYSEVVDGWYTVLTQVNINEPEGIRWSPSGQYLSFEMRLEQWLIERVVEGNLTTEYRNRNDSLFQYENGTTNWGSVIVLMDLNGNFMEFPFDSWSPES